jgi:hypothetical protein
MDKKAVSTEPATLASPLRSESEVVHAIPESYFSETKTPTYVAAGEEVKKLQIENAFLKISSKAYLLQGERVMFHYINQTW